MASIELIVKFTRVILAILLIVTSCSNCQAKELTKKTFSQLVGSNVNLFVNFYSPRCPHCISLKPTWSTLAHLVNSRHGSNVLVASVDCSEQNDLCNDESVNALPTLKLYSAHDKMGTDYEGPRDLNSLLELLKKQMGIDVEQMDLVSDSGSSGSSSSSGYATTGDAASGDGTGDDSHVDSDPLLNRENEDILVDEPVSGLYELTEETHKQFLSKGRHFVKFYAPWCGHCMVLEPKWYKLAQSFQHDKSVRISRLNCDLYHKVCQEYNVKGYPTLLWIVDGKVLDKYEGDRTVDAFKDYIALKTEEDKVSSDALRSEDLVVYLTQSNFRLGISQGTTLVMFMAPWCGHCKRLAPIIDALSAKVVQEKNIRIAKVDCSQFDELCTNHGVDGYPTLLLYQNGQRITEYEGDRTLDDLYTFLLSQAANDTSSKDEL